MDWLIPFRHKEVLFLLVIPALLLFWTWKRKGRSVVLPFDFADSSRGSWIRGIVGAAESLPGLLLTGAYAGHGIALSVRLGELAAQAILEGRALPDWGRVAWSSEALDVG